MADASRTTDARDILTPPEHGWVCFHCGEHFDTGYSGQRDARLHFGQTPEATPACKLTRPEKSMLMLVRHLQARETELLAQLHDEGGDAIKALRARESGYAEELRRAEELGYERGLRAGNYANEPGEWITRAKRSMQEVCDYLGSNGLNSIGSGSGFHRLLVAALASSPPEPAGCHGLDTPERVCFYEQDFYVLSNFSAFEVYFDGIVFPTSEHCYQWHKFRLHDQVIANQVRLASSAHDAFKIAEREKARRNPAWDAVKLDIMRSILRAKVEQHEYVRRKLLATGDRELVENSWRDSYWGWGPNRDGMNMLGKLWMEIRAELRLSLTKAEQR